MKIVLIGFMCSGKSKVGRALSKQLNWPLYDTDDMIVKQVGSSIADIINKKGEKEFRETERNVVRLVGMVDKCVVSTGGGVALNPDNMKELKRDGKIIWLKVRPETVLKRAGNLASRPLIDPKDPLNSIRKRLADREPVYAQAEHTIETDDLSPDDIAQKILSFLPAGAT